MNWQKGVAEALQKGKCFSQGNYNVSSFDSSGAGYCSDVFYHGHRVFRYSYHPTVEQNNSHDYDFCGYEGYPHITKLINCCLEAIDTEYRVKTVKDKVVEVPMMYRSLG